MAYYIVNKNAQSNGDHEVHERGCSHLPQIQNQHNLGMHTSCTTAVIAARRVYRQSNGCYHCCRPCHTS